MSTLLVCLGSLSVLLVGYFTYGRWLSERLFQLSADAPVPSRALQDDQDFVPTRKSIVFGHHFTSIAGTGPIVGPAIAVFWGWLPALTWIVLGAILIGGVHDLAALIISMRNRGQTIGEIAGRMISPRTKLLFLSILALALWIVLAIFGMVIATIFTLYPESVLSVWIAMPIAVCVGLWAHRGRRSIAIPSLVSLALLYLAIYVGVEYLPINIDFWLGETADDSYLNSNVIWTLLLLAYCYLASVLPVWLLLQPRDLINSHQLFVALGLLILGLVVASLSGTSDLFAAAEPISSTVPSDAPPMLPFLFITIACGACSGFHCLVSSGTSSKQIASERDAQAVGYGSMLLESGLAVVVVMACTAGIGMGALAPKSTGASHVGASAGPSGDLESGGDNVSTTRASEAGTTTAAGGYHYAVDADGKTITGRNAWRMYYRVDAGGKGWGNQKLDKQLRAFIEGGANFLTAIGIPLGLGIGIVAVLVASFAATTLDTATRLQRYIIQELGSSLNLPTQNKYVATGLAVGVAACIAVFAGQSPGKGGAMLWPLFGATNQLLAGLALMVATFYLWRRGKTIAVLGIPAVLMMLVPGWAMSYSLIYEWIPQGNRLLIGFGAGILLLQAWMFVEAALVWQKARGVIEPQLEPLTGSPAPARNLNPDLQSTV